MPCTDPKIVDAIHQEMSTIYRKLILKHPFFAMPAMNLKVVVLTPEECADPAHHHPITTMATDGTHLYVNPDGFLADPMPYKIFTVMHEILHCILLHCLRRGHRDRMLWNVAVDLVVNYILYMTSQEIGSKIVGNKGERENPGYELPGDCLFMKEINGEDIGGMSAEQVYELLKEHLQKKPQSGQGSQAMEIEFRFDSPGNKNKDGKNTDGKKHPKHHPAPGQPGGSCPNLEPKDQSASQDGDEGKNEQALQEKVEELASRWRELGATAIKTGQMRGLLPAGIVQLIEQAAEPIISWKRRLAKFMTAKTRSGVDWNRPSRRWLYQDMYMPSRRRPSLGRILVAVDTSGSVDDGSLAQFMAEVNAVSQAHNCILELASVDTVMTMTGTFGTSKKLPKKVPITGRGGTDFIEPFIWAENENRKSADKRIRMIIYLTDAYGRYPYWKIKIPTLWVLNAIPRQKMYYPPFGEVACLQD